MNQINNPNEKINKLRPYDRFTAHREQAQQISTQPASAKVLKQILPTLNEPTSAFCLIAAVIALMIAWYGLNNAATTNLDQALTSSEELNFQSLRF
jgi:cell division protein FtsL